MTPSSRVRHPRYEIVDTHKPGKQRYKVRLRAANGELVSVGEGYSSRSNAERAVDTIRRAAATEDVVELDA